jgi:hypothetical protein
LLFVAGVRIAALITGVDGDSAESGSASECRKMDTYQYKYGDRPLQGYTIQRAAGRGGFGEVYYAISDSGRQVALKAVQTHEQIELRGISQCMNLKSPHLVTIFDVKYHDQGKPFVVMEYVSGPSLADLLKDSPGGLGTQKAAFFLREIGKGLAFLHECGIVHRDLKPGNIFYENGYVKIGDYGLTKAIRTGAHDSQTVMIGSLKYMAPEVGAGRYDRSIDIYALGVLLYEMLTGQVPFLGSSPAEILMKHMTAAPDLTHIEEPFARVIRKALAKDPAARYQSVQEMVEEVFGTEQVRDSVSQFAPEELSVVAEHLAQKMQGSSAPPDAPHVCRDRPPRGRRCCSWFFKGVWTRRFRVAIAVLLIAGTMAIGGSVVVSRHARHTGPPRQMLDAEVVAAREAAEAGNMKIVLDVLGKYPGHTDLADLRVTAFKKLQSTYLSVAGRCSDRELDKVLNRRIRAHGVMVWDVSPRKDGHLWSCIQVQMSEKEYRYLQLFFPKGVGTLDDLQKEGLVKGARVQVYGFLAKVERHFLTKDEYGLNPLEAWEVADCQ